MADPSFPTADQVAHAIVAAARVVGVDPLAIEAKREGRTNAETIRLYRARSYAAVALLARFDCPKVSIGRMVGMGVSASASMSVLTRDVERGLYAWWRADHLDAVAAAIPGIRPADDHPPAEPEADPEPEEPVDLPSFLPERPAPPRQPAPAPARPRAHPDTIPRQDARDAPVMSTRWGSTEYRQPPPASGKRAAYDLLREAVQNTVAMTPKE